jgi:hypothetical protein
MNEQWMRLGAIIHHYMPGDCLRPAWDQVSTPGTAVRRNQR